MTTAATTIICSRDMCYLTLSPFSLGPQSAKEKARRGGPALRNPPKLSRLLVRRLPRLSQKIVVAPWSALHEELRLLTGLVVDRVVDGSEFRA
jgi:hypothetical protein